jgi:hypothetical protein
MDKRSVIHLFDPSSHPSPFDINFAVDAEFDVIVPYSNVKLEEINALVQDVIFSRGPSGVKMTGIFIGGRDMGVAMAMLDGARKAMCRRLKCRFWRILAVLLPPLLRWSLASRRNSGPSTIQTLRDAGRWYSVVRGRSGSPRA